MKNSIFWCPNTAWSRPAPESSKTPQERLGIEPELCAVAQL